MTDKKQIVAFIIILASGINAKNIWAADEAKVPCLKKDGSVGLNVIKEFDCNLAKNIVTNPQIEESHKKNLYDKLAEKLATGLEQNIDEMALLDQYFSHNGRDLLMDSAEIKNSCRLDLIADTKCSNEKNSAEIEALKKYKVDRLTSKLSGSGKNIFDKLKNQFLETRGLDLSDIQAQSSGQCPAKGASGKFSLESQLNEKESMLLIEGLKSSKLDAEGKNRLRNVLYNKYPQLKMLKRLDRSMGADGAKFIDSFEDYLKNYNSNTNGVAKDYLRNFFFEKKNQEVIAKGLALQCESLTKQVKKYLCSDLTQLGSSQELAERLFNKSNDPELNIEISKGFSCQFKNADGDEDLEALSKGESVEKWYKVFSEDLRPVPKPIEVTGVVNNFCQMYSCKKAEIAEVPSCKNGGPISSQDLINFYGCNEKKQTCSSNIESYVSYLESLEKTKNERVGILASVSDSKKEEIKSDGKSDGDAEKKRPRFSAFLENFVGVEGSLEAEGRKVTLDSISEKQREFSERRLEVVTPNKELMAATQNNLKVFTPEPGQSGKDAAKSAPPPATGVEEQGPRYDSFVVSSANEANRQNLINKASSSFHKAPASAINSAVTTPVAPSEARGSQNDELQRIKDELSDVVKGMKGSDKEKLETIARSNADFEGSRRISSDASYGRLNSLERERLEQYRSNLNAWESKLRTWQGQLNDQEVRIMANNGSYNNGRANSADNTNSYQGSAGAGAGGVVLKSSKGASGAAAISGSTGKAEGDAGLSGAAETIVNSENLVNLKKDSLKKLGIVVSDSFIIKVRHLDKIYEIPVKSFNHNGLDMLVPLLNEKNRDLAKIVMDSPLFSDYRQYQLERQKTVN